MNEDPKNVKTGDKVTAFVLFITDSNTTQDILIKLREIPSIKEAHMIYGDWDILIKVELNSLAHLTEFMMELRKNYAIKKSSTLIALNQ